MHSDKQDVRQSLLDCLKKALPTTTPDGLPSVLDSSAKNGLWAEATLPYNLRLAEAVGPLALVYGMSYFDHFPHIQ
jgi:hypothetical protein